MNRNKGIMRQLLAKQEFTVVLLDVIVVLILSIFCGEIFLTSTNLMSTILGMATQCIVAIGMCSALLAGCFDMSIGSTVALSSMAAALFMVKLGLNPWVSALLALVASMLVGAINGVLIGYVGLNPFIATLAMNSVTSGLVSVLTLGSTVSILQLENVDSFRVLGAGSIGPVPVMVIIMLALLALSQFMLQKSSIYMKVRYLGSNPNAAYLAGINVKKTRFFLYVFAAFMAGIAGVLSLSRFGSATTTLGQNMAMDIIAGGVIGGISMGGGIGSLIGAALGILLMNLIKNGLVLFKVSIYWQTLITGFIMVVAIVIDKFTHSGSRPQRKKGTGKAAKN